MQSERLMERHQQTGSRWILAPKRWGSAWLNQTFCPKMLQPLERLCLWPCGTRSSGC